MLSPEPWLTLFRSWMQLQGWSPRTVEEYGREVPRLFSFFQKRGLERLSEATRDTIADYRLHLFYTLHRGRPLALSSQCAKLGAVKAFFRFLRQERFLLVDPALDVELPRVRRPLPGVPSEKEVLAILHAPDVGTTLGLRDRAILELLYATGIRNSELRALRLDELEGDRSLLRVRHGKGNKSRVVPLGREAAWWLQEYLRRGRPEFRPAPTEQRVFLTGRGTGFGTRAGLAEVVRRAAARAGVKRKVTPHALRHAVATHMLRHGAGLRHLQEMLGHASAGTTQLYTRVEVSDLRRVHRRCHPRERGR